MRNKKPKSEHTSGETLGDTGKDTTQEDRIAAGRCRRTQRKTEDHRTTWNNMKWTDKDKRDNTNYVQTHLWWDEEQEGSEEEKRTDEGKNGKTLKGENGQEEWKCEMRHMRVQFQNKTGNVNIQRWDPNKKWSYLDRQVRVRCEPEDTPW